MADWSGIEPSKNVVDTTRPGFGDEGTTYRVLRLKQAKVEEFKDPGVLDAARKWLYGQTEMGSLAMDKKSLGPGHGGPNHRFRTEGSRQLGRLRSEQTGRTIDDAASEGMIARDE